MEHLNLLLESYFLVDHFRAVYLILHQASAHLASYFRAVHLTHHPSICVAELFSGSSFDFSSGVSPCGEIFSNCFFNSLSGVSPCGKLFSSCSFNSPSGVRPCGELFSSRSFNFNPPSGAVRLLSYFRAVHLTLTLHHTTVHLASYF